jgi:hypothetical protein
MPATWQSSCVLCVELKRFWRQAIVSVFITKKTVRSAKSYFHPKQNNFEMNHSVERSNYIHITWLTEIPSTSITSLRKIIAVGDKCNPLFAKVIHKLLLQKSLTL